MAGPEFVPEQGKAMLIVRALNGLKSYGASFRHLTSEQLHDLDYRPSIADFDVWMRPVFKPGWFMYYEYVLLYVNDVLFFSDDPLFTMKGIQAKFKLKKYNI